MKGLKLSKTSWLILSAGIFVVVLGCLGVTHSGQIKEKDELSGNLSLSSARLGNIEVSGLKVQLAELQEQLKESEELLTEAKDRLNQTVISVDVTDKLYEIASYYSVNVTIMGTSVIQESSFQGVNCSVISLTAEVIGSLSNIIDFITGLNSNFTTGFIRSAQIAVAGETGEDGSAASINMVAYSYEGS
jgi:hypothetical protein